jgi:hypothetical protein
MRAEFYREDDPSQVVATARWDGRRAVIEASDEPVRGALTRVFRPVPVVVDDAAFRSLGAHGEVVIEPGSVDWFRAAAYARAKEESLGVRLVPEVAGQAGWDPAAAYRTFGDAMSRIVERGPTQTADQVAST